MKVDILFGSYLAVDHINIIDNNSLKKTALELESKSPGVLISNEGGWQSDNVQMLPEMQPLVSLVQHKAQELFNNLGFKKEYTVEVGACWININRANHYNKPHTHVPVFLSAVYYISAEPGAGGLCFENPIVGSLFTIPGGIVEKDDPFNKSGHIEVPLPGKLLFFPSYISHYTQPNKSGTERISVAFNFILVEKT